MSLLHFFLNFKKKKRFENKIINSHTLHFNILPLAPSTYLSNHKPFHVLFPTHPLNF